MFKVLKREHLQPRDCVIKSNKKISKVSQIEHTKKSKTIFFRMFFKTEFLKKLEFFFTVTTFEVLSTFSIASSASSTTDFWAAQNQIRRSVDRRQTEKTDANKTTLSTTNAKTDANKMTHSTLSMTTTTTTMTTKVTSKPKSGDSLRRKADAMKSLRRQSLLRCRIVERLWTKRSTTSSASWPRKSTNRLTKLREGCRRDPPEGPRRLWRRKMTQQGRKKFFF